MLTFKLQAFYLSQFGLICDDQLSRVKSVTQCYLAWQFVSHQTTGNS